MCFYVFYMKINDCFLLLYYFTTLMSFFVEILYNIQILWNFPLHFCILKFSPIKYKTANRTRIIHYKNKI